MNVLNSFVITIPDDRKNILYNTYSNCIVSIGLDQLDGNSIVNMSQTEIDWLHKKEFFKSDEELIAQIRRFRKEYRDILHIIVAFTQRCNFNCPYCSQNDSKKNDAISFETIDCTIEYIKNVVENKGFERVSIDFFGGEPLLEKNMIFYLKTRLEEVVDSENIEWMIETNGSLLDQSFLMHFSKLVVTVPITSKIDHEMNRPFINGRGSFERIIKNLVDCNTLFNDNITLNLRYNVNGGNYNQLGSFLSFVKGLKLNVENIILAYIKEMNYNPFKNNLTLNQYSFLYSGQFTDLLMENGFKVWFPSPHKNACMRYSPYSIKVYPDGKIGMCNAQINSACDVTIFDVCSDVDLIGKLIPEKNEDVIDDECSKCRFLLFCGGKYACRSDNYCGFSDFDLEMFIRRYVDECGRGNGNCFRMK